MNVWLEQNRYHQVEVTKDKVCQRILLGLLPIFYFVREVLYYGIGFLR